MNVYGANFGFAVHQLSPYYQPAAPQPAPAQSQAPGAQPPAMAPPMPGGYLSSGYFMAAPQMQPPAYGGTAAYGGAMGAGKAEGGHVTANATNAMTSSSAGYPGAAGAMGGAAAYGMAGVMAMPVGFAFATPMLFMPVVFGFAAPVAAPVPPQAEVPTPTPAPLPSPAPAPAPVVEPEVPVPVSEVPAPVADEPEAEPTPKLPIVEMDAAEFERFRYKEKNAELSTRLALSLTTKDGDTVSLDFSQLDVREKGFFAGRLADGGVRRERSFYEDTDRVVNMAVDGELSDDERSAIDAVLKSVIEVANEFFNNDLSGALARLKSLDFDTDTLAELSLEMSMAKRVEYTKARGNGTEELRRLADRDGEISRVLDFFASEQKRLIESAGEVLDRPSAVKMVKSLLPPMIDKPLEALLKQVAEAPPEAPEAPADEAPAPEAPPAAAPGAEEDDD